MSAAEEDKFQMIKEFPGYIAKAEITNTKPSYLVKGSKNVLIDYANRIISRNGYTLFGAANDGGGGIKSSYEWQNSTGHELPLRSHDSKLQFYWNSTWNTLKSNLSTPFLEFAKVLDYNSQIDILLWVLGEYNYYTWSGAVAKLRSSTTTTAKKQGTLGSPSFLGSGASMISIANPCVVTIVAHGLSAGDIVQFSTSGSLPGGLSTNTNYYVIAAGLGADVFEISATLAGSAIITTGSQTGLQTCYLVSNSQAKGIAFVAGTTGVAATITDSHSNFVNAGFAAGDTLTVVGSPANSKNFTIASVAAGTITLIMSDSLTSESAGASIVLHNGEPTWASSRFLMQSYIIGTVTITHASPGVLTAVNHGLVVGDTVQFTTTSALPSGLSTGITYYVVAAGLDANNFEVSATSGGSAINTTSDGAGVHTVIKTTRKITYLGVDYTYTGGELTDTLTGLTSFPTATVGDAVWQTPLTIKLPPSITSAFPSFAPDLIGVQLNQVIFASTKSMMVFGSSSSDYTNFTITGSRVPGGPFQKPLGDFATCIIPIDNLSQSINSLMIGSGKDSFYKIFYQLSQDNTTELVNMVRLKTATGSGLISKDAIVSIKNQTAYITREPSLDTIANLEIPDAKDIPISDSIKDDFDNYDFSHAHVRYFKRTIRIALPMNGVVLIYDMMRKIWQPPQTIPIGRFMIYNDGIYGHSSVTNETYKLDTGTDDNGIPIFQVARFAYNNGGIRDRIKNMTEHWSDGYITANGALTMTVSFGFLGINGKRIKQIYGGDKTITNPIKANPLGNSPFGNKPFGGNNVSPITGLPGTTATFLRFWCIDTFSRVDYNEHYVEYAMNTLGGQFAIVAHGSNQEDVETSPVSHKR